MLSVADYNRLNHQMIYQFRSYTQRSYIGMGFTVKEMERYGSGPKATSDLISRSIEDIFVTQKDLSTPSAALHRHRHNA